MKFNKISIVILPLIFGAISINYFRKYLILKPILGSPIAYEVISSKVNKGGRGQSFNMTVRYQKQPYELAITGNDYRNLKKGKYPTLYYSVKLNEVFYHWTIKMSLRIALIFFVFFIVGCVLTFREITSIPR